MWGISSFPTFQLLNGLILSLFSFSQCLLVILSGFLFTCSSVFKKSLPPWSWCWLLPPPAFPSDFNHRISWVVRYSQGSMELSLLTEVQLEIQRSCCSLFMPYFQLTWSPAGITALYFLLPPLPVFPVTGGKGLGTSTCWLFLGKQLPCISVKFSCCCADQGTGSGFLCVTNGTENLVDGISLSLNCFFLTCRKRLQS